MGPRLPVRNCRRPRLQLTQGQAQEDTSNLARPQNRSWPGTQVAKSSLGNRIFTVWEGDKFFTGEPPTG